MTVVVTHTTPADSSFSTEGAAAWNADHALSGVGTMAEQNANSVAITGGAIDGTTLGATTPAAATFTTLTATGQTSLGGAAGSETVRVTPGTNTGKYTLLSSDAANNFQLIGGVGTTNLGIYSTGGGNIRFYSAAGLVNEQFRVTHTASAVNYVQVTGAATGATTGPVVSAQGSDSSIPLSFQSKLNSPINFFTSGGYQQFKITNNATAVNYPQVGGSATGNATFMSVAGSDTNISMAFQSKGTGAIDLAAGSSGVNISNGGTVTAITRTAGGTGYATAPTVSISAPTTAGGVQATATVAVSAGAITTFTITNAGSGYVEQPTVTFSGGGGSGAAAYASVGSNPVIKGLAGGSSANGLTFANASGNVLTLLDGLVATPSTLNIRNSGNSQIYPSSGTLVISGGTSSGAIAFYTNGVTVQQFAVAHTASAVNYVQVTGSPTAASTSATANIQYTGSDTNVNGAIVTKGTGYIAFAGGASPATQAFRVITTSAVSTGNLIAVQGAAAGSAPSIQAISGSAGTDTNIDLALTPKGTGLVRFGTYTAGAPTATGYISIKAADGTTYKVLVGT